LLSLLPGDLIASIGGKLRPHFFYPLAFVINAGAWLFVRKILPHPEPAS
jgi:hypothetical protein